MPVDYAALAEQARKQAPPPVDRSAWDRRADGSEKGDGFLGALSRPDGRVSSELSIGVQFDNGPEVEIPSLVPTLTKSEVQFMLTKPDDAPVPRAILDKAVAFARQRKAQGKPFFAGPGEQRADLYPDLSRAYVAAPVDYAALAAKARGAATPPSAPPAREKDFGDWIEQDLQKGVADLYTGIAKGAANTVYGLGKIAHDYTPIGRISDAIAPGAFDERPKEIVPSGTMQRLGYTGEQVGEFLIPTGATGTLGKVAEVAKSAGLTKAQTGSTAQAVLAGGLSAAAPLVVSGISSASNALRGSAEKTMAQALGATKEAMKVEAAKLAPQMLDRGISGTRAGMLAQASAQVKAVGQLIDQEVAAQSAAGATVSGLQVRGAVQLAADALKVGGANGSKLPIAGAEQAIKELNKLDTFVEALGPDIPFDKAQHIKQVWQHIVSKAGLYGPKAQSTATDAAAASAMREGASAFRELLANGSATLDDLNREFAFWKGLKTVLTATQARTQAQGMGITASIGGSTTGAVVGALAGGPGGSGVGAVLGPAVVKAMQSAWWKTTAVAPLKNALATALSSGNVGAVKTVAGRIAAAMPATLRTAAAQ